MKIVFLVLLLIINSFNLLYAQCVSETFSVKDWCENQYAEWTITNPDPNSIYHWFEPVYNTAGVIIDTIDRGYGEDGTGVQFISPLRYTTPTPTPTTIGWDKRKFWYTKETPVVTGPQSQINNAASRATTAYSVNFTSTTKLHFNSITIPFYSFYVEDAANFNIQVKFGTSGTTIMKYKGSDIKATVTGNTYWLTVPINLDLLAGTNVISVTITTDASQTGLAFFQPSNFTFPIASNAGISITGSSSSGTDKAMLFDWDVVSICPYKFSPEASKTTIGCCAAIVNNLFNIGGASSTIVSNSGSVILTAGSINSSSNYFAWYLDGAPIVGASAVGKTTYTATKAGVYSVREVKLASDINNISCYSQAGTFLEEKAIFASITSKPTTSPYCLGDKFGLKVSGNPTNIVWSPSKGVSTISAIDPVYTASAIGNIQFEVQGDIITGNRILNGDFESGNNATFTTDNSFTSGSPSKGQFSIATTVNTSGNSFWISDCSGNGKFYYSDCKEVANAIAWQQTVSGITTNKNYTLKFSYNEISGNDYLRDPNTLDANPTIFAVLINGQQVGSTFTSTGASCKWNNASVVWNSATASSAKIQIIVVNGDKSSNGVDFALDDIQFGGASTQKDYVTVGPITDCSNITAIAGTCKGDSLLITATATGGMFFDRWEYPVGTIIGKTNSLWIKPTTASTYTAFGILPIGNILQNGDFESSNGGFISGAPYYSSQATQWAQGGNNTYIISTDTKQNNGSWVALSPPSGNGKMFVADAKGPVGQKIIAWKFTAANAGDKYLFSGKIANQHNAVNQTAFSAPNAKIRVDIDGFTLLDIITPKNNLWSTYTATWTAPSAGTFTLSLSDLDGYGGPANDFVLDDFVLAPIVGTEKKVPVNVPACVTCSPPKVSITTSGPAPTVGVTPKKITICEGATNPTLSGSYTAGATAPTNFYQYLWYKKGKPIPAYTNSNSKLGNANVAGAPLLTSIADSGTYYLRVEDYNGTPSLACATIDSIRVVVVATPKVTAPTAGTICSGDVFSGATAYTTTPTAGVTVKWNRGTLPSGITGDATGLPKTGQVSEKLTSSNTAGTKVTYNLTPSVTQNAITCSGTAVDYDVAVNPIPTAPTTNPVVYCQNASAVALTAAITTGSGNSLKWYGTDATGGTASATAPTPVTTATGTTSYYVSQATAGTSSCEGPRLEIKVSINAAPAEPTATNPTAFCVGGIAPTFTATPTLSTNTLKWYNVATNGTSSATAPTINNTTPLTQKAWVSQESDVASGKCEGPRKELTVTLNPVTKITVQPTPTTTICEGAAFNLSATATGTGTITYQWKKNTVDTLSASATNTFGITSVIPSQAGSYTVEAKGTCGTDLSNIAALVVNTKPKITTDPTDKSGCVGSKISFSVVASGTAPLTYQWRKNGANISGATTDSYTINSIATSDEAKGAGEGYDVVVSNGCAPAATSSKAKLSVTTNETPSVTLTVDKKQICTGSSVKLTASGSGGTTQTFTFKKGDGSSIGTTNPLTTTALTADESFTVEMVTNSNCLAPGASNTVSSTPAVTVKVDALPTTSNPGTAKDICTQDYTLVGNVPTVGTGLWTADDATVTFDDATKAGAKASNIPKNKSVKFTWTISNGTCTASQNDVIIKQIGDMTSPLAGLDQALCGSTSLSVSLTGNVQSTLKTGEIVTWTKKNSSDPGTLTQSGNNATVTGLPTTTGKYTYVLTMTNGGICPPSIDEVDIVIVAPPVADITLPIVLSGTVALPGTGSQTFNTNPLPIKATQPALGYKGEWAVIKTVGIAALTSSSTTLVNSVDGMNYDESAKLIWKVTDETGTCKTPATDTVTIERKNITEAKAADDTVCFGSGSSIAYSQTPKAANLPNASTGEKGEWLAVGSSPAPVANTSTLDVNFTAPGDYVYTYRIYNPIILDGTGNPIESKNNFTIKVDALPTTSNAGTSENVCTLPYTLGGNAVDASKGETGLWTGGVTFIDATSNVSKANGMTDGSTYILTWSIFSKYKTCAASTSIVTLKKLKNITTAKISTTLKDYCEGTSFSLASNAADGANSETGEWTSTDLTVPTADKNNTTLPLSNLAQGTYTITWKISSSQCPGGSSDAITISVDKKPAVGTITSTRLCEEKDVAFTAAGFVSIKAPTYVWSAVANPSTTSTATAVSSTADKATYKVGSTATTGATDGITVKVDVKNGCGTTTVDTVYTFDLRPRGFAISFTSPILKICASDAGPVVYNVTVNPALPAQTDFNWYWNKETTPKATTGASYSLKSVDYISKTGNIDLEIRAYNQCGEAKASDNAAKTISVEISQSKKLEVTIKAALSDSVCVADVTLNKNQYIATAVTNGNNLSGSETYTFTVTDTLGNEYTTSTNTTGIYNATLLNDGDEVSVELSDPKGCFDTPRKAVADTVVNGFSYPNSTIITKTDTVCESKNSINLKVNRTRNRKGDLNDADIMWYKDGIAYDSSKYAITLGAPAQTGTYTVVMKGSVCPDSTTAVGIKAKIYELPAFEFSANPLVIIYQEGIVVPMPIVLTKPEKDVITNTVWNSDRWLKYPLDTVHAVIVPEREEVEINYNLSVSTGPKTLGCTTDRSLVVINTLPLRVPNAFSPNGDGVNDTWVIVGLNKYKSITVSVFNRWGSRVYYDRDGYHTPWDGTHNGGSLPTGTYYAVIELSGSPDNTDQNVTRSLTIVK